VVAAAAATASRPPLLNAHVGSQDAAPFLARGYATSCGMGPKRFCYRQYTLVRLRRTRDGRDAREPRHDVEVVRGFDPGDERALGDRGRERRDDKFLDAVPEGSGLSEKGLAWPRPVPSS